MFYFVITQIGKEFSWESSIKEVCHRTCVVLSPLTNVTICLELIRQIEELKEQLLEQIEYRQAFQVSNSHIY
jgi:hypothetical protein